MHKRKQIIALFCGLLGCLCLGAGDWLMMYGDPTYTRALYWLTEGIAQIAPWRMTLAMVLAFPGVLFYGTAWVSLRAAEKRNRQGGNGRNTNFEKMPSMDWCLIAAARIAVFRGFHERRSINEYQHPL